MYVCMYVSMYVCMLSPALENTREGHNRKILFALSVEEYANHLLVSKVTVGLMTNNKNPKSLMVMLV